MENQGNGVIRQHQSKIAFIYRVFDAVIIWYSLLFSAHLHGISPDEKYIQAAFAAMIAFYITGESMQLYRSWRGVPLKQMLQPLLFSWLFTITLLLLFGYATKTTGSFSRMVLGGWAVSAPLALIGWRVFFRGLLGIVRARGYNSRMVAIAGANHQGARLGKMIQETPSLGMRLHGFHEDREVMTGRINFDLPAPIKGNFKDLVAEAKNGKIDLVYIALPMKGQDRINELVSSLSDTTSSVYVVPDLLMFDLLTSRWVNVGDIPTVSIFETPFYGVDGWVKRLEDILLSSLILVLISIPMLLIGLVIKFTSKGPVLFKQKRYGLDGRQIRVWKFRSMHVIEDDNRVVQAKKTDSRITPFGAFLRRTSLDELPQFFNVLKGEMSIVGPRPHAVVHNEEYRKLIAGYMLRHKVKPGITGWAQVNGWRGETDTLVKMRKRIEFDLWYIRSWTLMFDLKIICITIFKGFCGKNAY